MQLRTVIGAHAGEVRDYTYTAAVAALRDGMAVPVTEPEPTPLVRMPQRVAEQTERTGRRNAARRE